MYRALATANAFARNGWRVTVLTTTRETFERLTGSDPEAEQHIDPSIEVVRIPFEPSVGEADIAKWSRLRVFSPLLWNFLRFSMSRVPFPEIRYGSWRRPLARAAESIHRQLPVDLVVGSANPNVDFVPGMHLKRKFGVPYVMDYRDTWHLDVYSGRTIGSPVSRSQRMEKRLIAGAEEVWFVNSAIRDWHARRFPGASSRFHVVANGYDPGFLAGLSPGRKDGDDALTFGFLGTVYGPMPLRETLEGWRIARSRSPLVAASRMVFRGRLGHFAQPDPKAQALLEEFASDGVTYAGPVSKAKVASVYADFDVLLLILGKSKYVTSGKVFEYAATGLPIASLHHPETAATAVLTGYPRHHAVRDITAEEVAATLIAAAEHATTAEPRDLEQAREWSRHLSRDAQLLPRVEALRAAVRADEEVTA